MIALPVSSIDTAMIAIVLINLLILLELLSTTKYSNIRTKIALMIPIAILLYLFAMIILNKILVIVR